MNDVENKSLLHLGDETVKKYELNEVFIEVIKLQSKKVEVEYFYKPITKYMNKMF